MTRISTVERILEDVGPSRSSTIAKVLAQEGNVSSAAARQRLTRARAKTIRRTFGLLPKQEVFMYLNKQWNGERYWTQLLRDLRATGSIYGSAIDGICARGGIVPISEFDIVSGAPLRLKKQVNSEWVAVKLIQLKAIRVEEIQGAGTCYVACPYILDRFSDPNTWGFPTLHMVEKLALEGLREWIGKNSVGAYTKIAIRNEDKLPQVGSFLWDLTAPSYLSPIRRNVMRNSAMRTFPGFVVADSFATRTLEVAHIQYFLRKIKVYERTSNSGKLLPILMAQEFSEHALKTGRAEGIMMVTPQNLFGSRVAMSLQRLLDVLNDVSYVLDDVEGLCFLIDSLAEIEGRSGNMRGILFEFLVAHVVQHSLGAKDLEFRVQHTERVSGKRTDLDIVFKRDGNSIHVIECKGKHPGGTISVGDVSAWLEKIPLIRDYLETRPDLRNLKRVYEFWTSGRFQHDALVFLQQEKARRTRQPINFMDGGEVCELAGISNQKEIVRALNEHFLNHPLAHFRYDGTDSWKKRTGLLHPTPKQLNLIRRLQLDITRGQDISGQEYEELQLSTSANRAQASDHIRLLIGILDNQPVLDIEHLDKTRTANNFSKSDGSSSLHSPASGSDSESDVPF